MRETREMTVFIGLRVVLEPGISVRSPEILAWVAGNLLRIGDTLPGTKDITLGIKDILFRIKDILRCIADILRDIAGKSCWIVDTSAPHLGRLAKVLELWL